MRLTQAPQHFASQRLRLSGKSPRSLEELRKLSYPQCGVDKLVVLTLTAAVVLTERGSPMATLMVT